jgi:hypothetical protein
MRWISWSRWRQGLPAFESALVEGLEAAKSARELLKRG